jgi:hypothetical protein
MGVIDCTGVCAEAQNADLGEDANNDYSCLPRAPERIDLWHQSG